VFTSLFIEQIIINHRERSKGLQMSELTIS